jgi:hypothetical protein
MMHLRSVFTQHFILFSSSWSLLFNMHKSWYIPSLLQNINFHCLLILIKHWRNLSNTTWIPSRSYIYLFTVCTATVIRGGPGSSVVIVTDYGLDSLGIESCWGEIFCTCPDRPWGPPSLLYNGYRVFPGGRKRPGHDADPSPPSSAEV